MAGIDESRKFLPVAIAVLTVSDSRGPKEDESGKTLIDRLEAAGHTLAARAVVKDDVAQIRKQLTAWIDDPNIDVVITTGGTGLTGRDVTPEAVEGLYEKKIEGFGELFRWISYGKVGTSTIQSRAVGGVCRGTYLFSLPGSPSACRDGWDEILRFQLDSRYRPCNLVELMPRLLEHVSPKR
ncbi:MAG TPA: molybdenum cofactor biosynthesis protein B [Alphaproteobacteria bacterium]|nr:molybdenum cofactor biosynthesis protein B [Alphaproteobacteria bacterium]